MRSNSSGSNNIAVGNYTLFANTTGSHNIAIGESALDSSMFSNNTLAIGDSAMYNYKGGGDNGNTAIGSQALYSLSTMGSNTAIGHRTLYKNKGSANTALGDYTLTANDFGNNNTGVGAFSLFTSYGDNNSVVGVDAMRYNTRGDDNTSFGFETLFNNTLGSKNVAIGNYGLASNTIGSKNIALGYNSNVTTFNLQNAVAIGADASVACSSCMSLGSIAGENSATTNTKVGIGISFPQTTLHVSPNAAGSILIGGNKTAGGFTDLELGISANLGGYSYIQSTKSSGSTYGDLILNQSGGNVGIRTTTPLSPLHIKQTGETFPVNGGGLRLERVSNSNHWDVATDQGNDLDFTYNGNFRAWISDVDGAYTSSSDLRLKKDIQLIGNVLPAVMQLQPKMYHYKDTKTEVPLSYGFIAQEVEKLFPDFVKTKGEDGMKGITYQYFSVLAIKAIQEQQTTIDAQNKRIEKLEQQMELLLKK
jgi:hypothetical protein